MRPTRLNQTRPKHPTNPSGWVGPCLPLPICVIPQRNQSKLRIFVVVNKVQIYQVNARYGTHHTPTQHALRQYPNQILGVTCSDTLVTERVWLFYKYIPTRRPQIETYFTQNYFQLVHDFDLIDTFTKPLSYNNKP